DGVNNQTLWRTDGTAAGTAPVAAALAGNQQPPAFLTAAGSELFFAVFAGNSPQIWATDGTDAGTTMLGTGLRYGIGTPIVAVDGVAYFAHGADLWRSDGTTAGTTLVDDIRPGSGSSLGFTSADLLVNGGGTLYFHAN